MAKKRILTFNAEVIAKHVQHALASKEHRPSFAELYNPAYHKGGKVKTKNGFPDGSNIDPTKVPAALMLVADHGIYLMSNGAAEGCPKPAYAVECDPTTMDFDAWYENKREIMGGDDGADALPVAWFEIALGKGLVKIQIQVLAKSIRLL